MVLFRLSLLARGFIFIPKTFIDFYRKYINVTFVVLLGLPRSGTSVLLDKLNNHNSIYFLYEPMRSLLQYGKKNPIRYVPYYEFDKNVGQICGMSSSNLLVFGEKSIYGSSKILNFFIWFSINFRSKDKFILLTRDPKSRYLSYKKWIDKRNRNLKHVKSQLPKSVIHETNRWIKFTSFCNQYNDKENVLVLNYENMICDSVGFFNILGNFLKIDMSSISIDDLYNSSLEKWKTELTDDEIEYICSKTDKLFYHSIEDLK